MATQDLIDYYKSLLIMQYASKPRALAHIEALAGIAVMDSLPNELQSAFNLDTATGVQLDVVGKIVGVSRRGRTFTKVITLVDDEYRQLIRIAIVKNSSKSSLFDIQTLLNEFFGKTLLVFDYQNMSMSYLFDAVIGTENLAELFIINGLLPKPMGVALASLIYIAGVDTMFGMRSYSLPGANISPLNSYADYNMNARWLSYSDAIVT